MYTLISDNGAGQAKNIKAKNLKYYFPEHRFYTDRNAYIMPNLYFIGRPVNDAFIGAPI